MNKTSISILAATAIIPVIAKATIVISTPCEVTRPIAASGLSEQLSGITWIGGDDYFAVDDTDKRLWKLTIPVNRADGSISTSTISVDTNHVVVLSGASDLEGCAYDPASGHVWASDETGATIKEYDTESGSVLRTVPVPSILRQYRGNFSLESLTISGDGLTMWTANEEALKTDGPISTNTVGTLVRLTKFSRASVKDGWTLIGQWAYRTDPFVGSDYNGGRRSGVSGLCALPDGSLLVLEREMSCKSTFFGINYPSFRCRIYRVTNYSSATNVSAYPALDNAVFTTVSKGSALFDNQSEESWGNYEAICLGPRLSDGSTALVLVSDAGSSANKNAMVLKLSGLDVRTLYVEGADNSEPVGGPYRYVGNTTVSATLPGAGSPYEASLRVHPTWTAAANGASGEGSVASFTISADDTLRWAMTTNSTLPMLGADSFERIAAGTEAPDLPGWNGDGVVTAASYTPALPPGYPLQDETHSQVLVVDGEAVRSYATLPGTGAMVDVMLRVTRETTDSPVEDAEGQIAIFFAEDGRATLQHKSANGATRLRTPLSSRVFANNDWVRASLLFDYANGPSGSAWCQVRINGEPCVTDAGVQSPANPVSPGAWYRTLDNGAAGKVAQLALIGFGAVDDVALYDAAGAFEFDTSAGTSTNGVPYSWFNDQGLAWDPAHDMDGDTHTARDEFAAGTDPWDALDFLRILATDFDEEGRFRLYFNGEADASHYFVDEVEDLVNDTWSPATGYGQILQSHGTNVWTQATQPENAAPQRFFRVRVVIPEE